MISAGAGTIMITLSLVPTVLVRRGKLVTISAPCSFQMPAVQAQRRAIVAVVGLAATLFFTVSLNFAGVLS